jgi:hypothetical protein
MGCCSHPLTSFLCLAQRQPVVSLFLPLYSHIWVLNSVGTCHHGCGGSVGNIGRGWKGDFKDSHYHTRIPETFLPSFAKQGRFLSGPKIMSLKNSFPSTRLQGIIWPNQAVFSTHTGNFLPTLPLHCLSLTSVSHFPVFVLRLFALVQSSLMIKGL